MTNSAHSMRLLIFCLLFASLLPGQPVFAERAKIGLALSGGGAKGGAHIAVLAYLEANHIVVDYIAGTSIGAYIGGMYALGYSAAQINDIVFNQDLGRGYSDTIPRQNLPFRKKDQNDKFNLPVEIGFRDGQIHIPSGFLYGQTLSNIYRASIGNIINLKSFDELAIPFRAIATDLTTSDPVVLDSGSLIKAMQASATVPGALVPVEIDGKYLIDGGLSNNIPVDVVKQMGADIVIAVDISSSLLNRQELDNNFAVVRQVSAFLTIKNIDAKKLLLTENDIYIRPLVAHLNATDFDILPKAYAAGIAAVNAQQQQMQKLAVDAGEFSQYQSVREGYLARMLSIGNEPVSSIVIQNSSAIESDFLLQVFDFTVGKAISNETLIAGIDRVYGLDRYEHIDTEFIQNEAGLSLVVNAKEKSWGPNFFEMGLSWEDDFTLDSSINLDFAFTMGKVTDHNGEWRNEVAIGTDKGWISELYLPLDKSQRIYHSQLFEFNRANKNYFINNQRAVIFEQNQYRLDFTLGYKYHFNAIVEAGISFESGVIRNELVLQDNLEYSSDGVFIRAIYDSLDRISFPTQGYQFNFDISYREEDVAGDQINGGSAPLRPYFSTQYRAGWKAAVSNGNHGLVGKVLATYLSSESDTSIIFEQLGGFLNLSGYHKNALVGNNKFFGSLSYQYNIGRSVFGLKDFPLYLGASIEVGNVWLSSESSKLDDLITAGSLFLGTNTALGPVALGFGISENNVSSIYFYLGKNTF